MTGARRVASRRTVPLLIALVALLLAAALVSALDIAPAAQATYSLWPVTTVPVTSAVDNDPASVELGVRVRFATAGMVTGVRFYKGSGNGGTHTGAFWTAGGRKLASGTFTGETTVGWQTLTFAEPVPVAANTTYVASYHAPQGHYADDQQFFASQFTAGPLSVPRNGGVYAYSSTSSFPRASWNASNYWVDVLFSPGVPPTSPPPSMSGTTTPVTTTSSTTTPPTSTPPPSGTWPTTANTGASGPLSGVTPPTGELILGDNGQSLTNTEVHGTITVVGCGVTIRNVQVDASEAYSGTATPDLFAIWDKAPVGCTTTIDHVTVLTPAGQYATEAVRDAYGSTQHITSLKAVGQQLGVTVGSADSITDSYIELASTLRGDHNEAILDDGTTGLDIIHNTLLNPNGQTSAISLFTEFGSNHDILVQDNWLAGGGFACYCGDGLTDNAGNPAPADNVSFVGNVFAETYFLTVGYYAPGRAYRASNGGQWSANVYALPDGTVTNQLVPQPSVDGAS